MDYITHYDFGDSLNRYNFTAHNALTSARKMMFNRPKENSFYVRVMRALMPTPLTRKELNKTVGVSANSCPNVNNSELGQMVYAQLLEYNKKTRKWSLGKNAIPFMEKHDKLFFVTE